MFNGDKKKNQVAKDTNNWMVVQTETEKSFDQMRVITVKASSP